MLENDFSTQDKSHTASLHCEGIAPLGLDGITDRVSGDSYTASGVRPSQVGLLPETPKDNIGLGDGTLRKWIDLLVEGGPADTRQYNFASGGVRLHCSTD